MTEQTDERFPVTEWDFDELRLRPYRDSDAKAVVDACTDPLTQRYLHNLPNPYTLDDAYEFIRGPAAAAWRQGRAQWAVVEAATDEVLGSVGVPRTTPAFGTAEIGYIVAPWARGRGIAARATAQVTEFLFQQGVARVELHIMLGNVASQHAAVKAGFTLDGRQRQAITTREGGQADKWVFARLPSDPPGPVPRAIPDLPDGKLTDGVVTLRRLEPGDAADHLANIGQPDVWQRNVPPVEPTRESVGVQCQYGAAEQWLHGTAAHMSIRDAATDTYAGAFGVYNGTGPPGEMMLSYSLAEQGRGRGFATRAVRLAARWAITELGARRVMAGTATDNEASQAVLARAGFTREGVQRALLPGMDDTRVDNVCWSLLPGES